MNTRRQSIARRVLAFVGVAAACLSVAGLPLHAAQPQIAGRVQAPDTLETFSTDFWATHFGLPFATGASAILLTVESVSVAGLGAWDAAPLGDDGVAALEEFVGEPVLRTWEATVVGAGAAPGALPAQFVETYRAAIPEAAPSAEELGAAGLSVFSQTAAAGLFAGPMGEPVYVYGIVATVGPIDRPAVSVFVPLGRVSTQLLAESHAGALTGSVTGAPGGGAGVVIGDSDDRGLADSILIEIPPEDCDALRTIAFAIAERRYNACVKNAAAIAVATIAACSVGCWGTGPGYLACMAVCSAAAITAEQYAISACEDIRVADRLAAEADHIRCMAQ